MNCLASHVDEGGGLPPPSRLLSAVHDRLGPLVGAAAWGALESLAARLPPAWSWLAIELRLSPGASRVDLAACCAGPDGGRAALAREPELLGPPHARGFVRAWASPVSSLYPGIPAVWMEYDLPDGEPHGPLVFLCFGDDSSGSAPTAARLRELVAAGLSYLAPAVSAAALATLECAARALPIGGRILHVAALADRGRDEIRIVASIPRTALAAWLDAITWPGPRDLRDRALTMVDAAAGAVLLHLDLADVVGPYLAVEHYAAASGPAPHWERFLGELVALGLCAPEKVGALTAWSGHQIVHSPAARTLHVERRAFGKLAITGPTNLEAKAYLTVGGRCSFF